MAIHERVWEQGAPPPAMRPRPNRPIATYTLLGILAAVFVLEKACETYSGVIAYHGQAFQLLDFTFVIDTDWIWRPWTLVTSTLAHDPDNLTHILLNGLFLFFFGPLVERILGPRRYVTLFFVAGALTGIVQVHLTAALGELHGAIGASGALMALFGLVIFLLPRERIFLYGVLPVPMWAAGIGYAALDFLGVFDPYSTTGHFAHLSGLALGLAYGAWFKAEMQKRGMRLVRS